MALGDLTSIEKRNGYSANIQLGKDVGTQTELISKSTNTIIVSQESIRYGIDNLFYSIAELNEGIQGLKAAFEFDLSEV